MSHPPRVLGLSHVALFSRDIDRSRAFYKDFFGFAEPYSLANPDGTTRLAWIKINDRQSIELFAERQPGGDRLNHIALEVEDAEAMRAHLASHGVAVPEQVPKGKIGNPNFTIKDPDGHGVEFVQYDPAGWTAREKGNFIPATRVSNWMSHPGILVRNLDASKAFYHDVLGMPETWRGSRDGQTLSWVNMQVPGTDDYLELMLYAQYPGPEELGVRHHLCLVVPDMTAAVNTLNARSLPADCKPPAPPRVGMNGRRQINYFDPDGTRVELMEPTTANGQPVPPSTAPLPAA